jgi:hypothetical protein
MCNDISSSNPFLWEVTVSPGNIITIILGVYLLDSKFGFTNNPYRSALWVGMPMGFVVEYFRNDDTDSKKK